MILPIIAYGDPVLRKVGADIEADYPDLQTLIDNMFETMYNAKGVGLAAPQIGLDIRLFIIDSKQVLEANEDSEEEGLVEVFINATILEENGKKWAYSEGCLSIPNINEDVSRQKEVVIEYYDRDFNFHTKTFDGFTARVIQHEYDHIEGTLFTDHISPLKRRMLKRKLDKISKGTVDVAYKMKFPSVGKRRR